MNNNIDFKCDCGEVYWSVEKDHYAQYPNACDDFAEHEYNRHLLSCKEVEDVEYSCAYCDEVYLRHNPGYAAEYPNSADIHREQEYERHLDDCLSYLQSLLPSSCNAADVCINIGGSESLAKAWADREQWYRSAKEVDFFTSEGPVRTCLIVAGYTDISPVILEMCYRSAIRLGEQNGDPLYDYDPFAFDRGASERRLRKWVARELKRMAPAVKRGRAWVQP